MKIATMVVLGVAIAASAALGGDHRAGLGAQLGLRYISGVQKLADGIEDNNPHVSADVLLPVGLALDVFYELENGIAFSVGCGPATIGTGDATFYVVPVGADVRYQFLRDKDVSPFVRVGLCYPIAGGDYIDSGSPGFTVGGGIEFWRTRPVCVGIDAGYNSSEVTVSGTAHGAKQKVKTGEFTCGLFVRF